MTSWEFYTLTARAEEVVCSKIKNFTLLYYIILSFSYSDDKAITDYITTDKKQIMMLSIYSYVCLYAHMHARIHTRACTHTYTHITPQLISERPLHKMKIVMCPHQKQNHK